MGIVVLSMEAGEQELREHRTFLVMKRGFDEGTHWMTLPALLGAQSDAELLAAAKELRNVFLERAQDIPALPGVIVQVDGHFHVVTNRTQLDAAAGRSG